MTEGRSEWTTEDYDAVSFHDSHIHGWRIAAGEEPEGALTLDIDYIVEWLQPGEDSFGWRIAPATLAFGRVLGLRLEIDYAAGPAAMTPCSIAEIGRERVAGPLDPPWYRWWIRLNWPEGRIAFESTGFWMRLRKGPAAYDHQCLSEDERR